MTGSAIFSGAGVLPRKAAVGGAGGGEIGRAVRHVDQIGRVQRPAQRGHAGPRDGDALDLFRRDVALARGIGGGLGQRVIRMPAGHQLDRHVGHDVPGRARDRLSRDAQPPRRRRRRTPRNSPASFRGRAPRRYSRAVPPRAAWMPSNVALPQLYSRATLVSAAFASPPAEVAARPIACVVCSASSRSSRAAAPGRREDRARRAVKPAHPRIRHRVDDTSGQLVAEHDRRQHVLAARAVVLGDRQRGRGQRRAAMHDVAQIAVVRGRRVAHHRVDLRRARRPAVWRRHRTTPRPAPLPPRSCAMSRTIAADSMPRPSRRWRACWRSASPRDRPPAPADRRA